MCRGGDDLHGSLATGGEFRLTDQRRERGRIVFQVEVRRARHWRRGAWHDLDVRLTDLSSRGLGLIVASEVQRGDRLSLEFAPGDGGPDLRVTLEIRHVQSDGTYWRAGGLFRILSADDHQRIVRILSDQTGT